MSGQKQSGEHVATTEGNDASAPEQTLGSTVESPEDPAAVLPTDESAPEDQSDSEAPIHDEPTGEQPDTSDEDGVTDKKKPEEIPENEKASSDPTHIVPPAPFSQRAKQKLSRHPAIVIAAAAVALWVVASAWYMWPRQVAFSFQTQNCISDITFLPNSNRQNSASTFSLTHKQPIKLGGTILFSRQTCIEPVKLLRSNTTASASKSIGGLTFKRYRITVPDTPKVMSKQLAPTIGASGVASLPLNQNDRVFSYQLVHHTKTTDCTAKHKELLCDVTPLALKQGQQYTLELTRTIGGSEPARLLSWQLHTATPVTIKKTSFPKGGVVYSKPKLLTLTTNKPLTQVDVELHLVKGKKKLIPHKTTTKDKTINIQLASDLPRETSFVVTVAKAVARDNGQLAKPYRATFSTSGGPKVTGTSIGRYSVSQYQGITVYFDQPVATAQNLSKAVALLAGDSGVSFTARASGSSIRITPTRTLPFCTPLTIKIASSITSPHGLSGDSAWQYNSRTVCHTVSTIGTSVKGRAIQAWKFGTGATKILYVGGTHGTEANSKYLMDYWIDELEANPHRIPKGRSIVVIPNLNPDGVAAGSRRNARNVDLNRNFPTDDWKKNVTMPDGTLVKGGGGSKPLSEPESRALANYVTAHRPRLVLTYHAVAALVSPNGTGNSASLAKRYSSLSGYRYLPGGEVDSVFKYDTCGAFEDWLPKLGIPAILVELGWGSEFYRNQDAMWTMAKS